ncbi:MAG: hypothetical protein ACLUVG_20740 [Phocaeicola vulgatus]
MALTTEEEAKVKKIVTAYDNGKRLNELPVADSSNPFDLTTERYWIKAEKANKLVWLLCYLMQRINVVMA